MSRAFPIYEAAAALDMGESTLRAWIAKGAPVARRGRRGRGCATLVDPAAVAAWRRAVDGQDAALALAGQLPELVADAVYQSFIEAEGVPKTALAGILAATWYRVAAALLDHLRESCPEIPAPSEPQKIALLRAINERFGRLVTTTRNGRDCTEDETEWI